ncbi:MAG: M20 family metallopeptidase [Verrucomicrobiota bacterium]
MPSSSISPVIETLKSLVSINSVNPAYDGPGEKRISTWIRNYFEQAGIEVWESEVLPDRPNIIARLPSKNPERRIVFEAHTDVVTTEGMQIEPFEARIEGNRLYGRGACDNKGGVAAMMEALRSLKAESYQPNCEIWFCAAIDEEYRHRGVDHLVKELKTGPTPLAAIVAEPTELRAIRANKGVLRWSIVTHGKAAHSSKPHLGINAIADMARVILALEADGVQLAKSTPHPLVGAATCNIGLINGGLQVNFVPDRCEIQLDRRLLPGEQIATVLAHYQGILDEVRIQHPQLKVEMLAPNLTDEAMETPANAAVVTAASRALEKIGLNPEPAGVPYGCDCTKLSRAGIPSLIYGPGSIDRAHVAIEYVEVDQVEKATTFYREFIKSFE